MKTIILLALITISAATFCSSGRYDISYTIMHQDCLLPYNQTLTVESRVRTFDGRFAIKNIRDVKVGDLVQSFNGYTEVTAISNINFEPRLFTSDLSNNFMTDTNANIAFTDDIPVLESESISYSNTNNDCGPYHFNYTSETIYLNSTYVDHTYEQSTCALRVLIPSNSGIDLNCDGHYDSCAHTENVDCDGAVLHFSQDHQYDNQQNPAWISDMVDYINQLESNIFINFNPYSVNTLYQINQLEIYNCDAINIQTANGYIVVNDILFEIQ